ncbi:hypothetical protein EN851_07760 [Mesorhizobium sp. M8A.F.Ca.ET.208.01.1.1]|uniref:hypothetical protein n=1 Tax=unclassified Mesorhizobium TaxID=325217 RepID=UPI0010937B50|nr:MULTISPECIES: hypothetical protein [unclassified Mesorhizobium]TGQ95404.1 hypothetical protein EN851_07760 [Mesorhizobium sp. M8A.F.Ca.ET.208.01.1.1]TGT55895.1 hypothetical protein EN810_07760 [Mesorhizobium sp. M8A.F.Ca.ET.167.01.1.1]
MQKVLMALLDKRRALKTEADAINAAIDKADGEITSEQESRLKAMQEEGTKVSADLDAFAATLPEDADKVRTDAVAAAVAATWREARDLHSNIAATCHIGNQSAKASAFIKDGKSLAEVQEAVGDAKAKGSGSELSNKGSGSNADGPTWDKAIARQNARLPS